MSDRESKDEQADERREGFELPLDRERDTGPPRLRRRLLGVRRGDVASELAARDAELAELRRDVSALWLAFGQHERTLHQVLAALEKLTETRIEPPGGRAPSQIDAPEPERRAGTGSDGVQEAGHTEDPGAAEADAAGTSSSGLVGASLTEQLSDLDEVLAAIEQATHSLEQTYAEQIAEAGDEDNGAAKSGDPSPETEPKAERDEPDPQERGPDPEERG